MFEQRCISYEHRLKSLDKRRDALHQVLRPCRLLLRSRSVLQRTQRQRQGARLITGKRLAPPRARVPAASGAALLQARLCSAQVTPVRVTASARQAVCVFSVHVGMVTDCG